MKDKTITSREIEQYIEKYTSPVSEKLQDLERYTHLNVLMPQMLSGSYQGKFLEFVSKMVRPKFILEIGTYTGYSALCLAKGLQPDGMLRTIDVNIELMEQTKKTFSQSEFADQIKLHIGDAKEIVPGLKEIFDLVFIDADKAGYWGYFQLAVDKVRSGGVILVDNVLWNGWVTHEQKDKKTELIHVFNEQVHQDDRVENLILPIRDGMMWIVKK